MSKICVDSEGHSIRVSRTRSERERAVAACINGECRICESEDEACDSVNSDTPASISGKRSRSDSSPSSRSSSPEDRPTKRLCVASALPMTEPVSPGANGNIGTSPPGNDTPEASPGCLISALRQAYVPPPLRPGDPLEEINIYIDGSALGQGQTGARAGLGVWYEDRRLSHLDRSERLQGLQTNSRAELTAAIVALQSAPLQAKIILHTDSQCTRQAMILLPKWKFRGFRNASGGRVANMDLVLQLEIQFNKRRGNVKWKQVKSHSGIRGNEWADRLAKLGANKPLLESSP